MKSQVPLRSDTGNESSSISSVRPEDIQTTFGTKCIDLVSGPLGSTILSYSDEFFASAVNLITATPPIRNAGVYTPNGAWYDGWETRRHNPNPFDFVIIKFGVASGQILGIEIDTAFFNGNHAPAAAVEACVYHSVGDELTDPSKDDKVEWDLVLPIQPCGPSARHAWRLPQPTEKAYTHARLLMYPDGGIARFRLYGLARPVFPEGIDTVLDLASLQNGGRAIAFSDQHYGTASNLLLPGRGINMGDGWETKRSRDEGHTDWVIIQLGARGTINKIIVDTAHFIGNFPQAITVKACDFMGSGEGDQPGQKADSWVEILGPQKCRAHYEHVFEEDVLCGVGVGKAWTHVMLTMIPDGGVKRFRVFGSRVV